MLKSDPWSRLLGTRELNRNQRSYLGPQEVLLHPQEESGAQGATGQPTILLIVTASVSGAEAGANKANVDISGSGSGTGVRNILGRNRYDLLHFNITVMISRLAATTIREWLDRFRGML